MTWRPHRGFRLGAMRERIDVQSVEIAVSDAGDRSETWSNTITSEPAAVDPVSGGETLRGRQVEAGINVVFTVHYRTNYTPEMRGRVPCGTRGLKLDSGNDFQTRARSRPVRDAWIETADSLP